MPYHTLVTKKLAPVSENMLTEFAPKSSNTIGSWFGSNTDPIPFLKKVVYLYTRYRVKLDAMHYIIEKQ